MEWSITDKREKRGNNWYVYCKCSCGKEKWVSEYSLKTGKSLSCGHERRTDVKEVIGKKKNKLTVISIFRKDNKIYCHCKCDCGKYTDISYGNFISGHTKSCGCANIEKYDNIVGRRFGMLQAIKRVDNIGNRVAFLCKCECGKEKVVKLIDLQRGHTKSCGNHRNGINLENITGNKYGKLMVIKYIGNKNNKSRWLCKCDCGNYTEVGSDKLKLGHTQSCGCFSAAHSGSKIENEIKEFLLSLS